MHLFCPLYRKSCSLILWCFGTLLISQPTVVELLWTSFSLRFHSQAASLSTLARIVVPLRHFVAPCSLPTTCCALVILTFPRLLCLQIQSIRFCPIGQLWLLLAITQTFPCSRGNGVCWCGSSVSALRRRVVLPGVGIRLQVDGGRGLSGARRPPSEKWPRVGSSPTVATTQPRAGVSCCRRHCICLTVGECNCGVGGDNPHARPLLDVLRVAKTQATVLPIRSRRARRSSTVPGSACVGSHCQSCRTEDDFRWGGCDGGGRECSPFAQGLSPTLSWHPRSCHAFAGVDGSVPDFADFLGEV